MHLIYTVLLCSTLFIFYTPSAALRANPQSPCASLCGNISSTSGDEISCYDDAYADTSVGQQFQACIACEINSTSVDPGTGSTDLQWLLYNLRYTVSYCLWGYPDNPNVTDVPCLTQPACGGYQSNIEYNNLSSSVGAYDYCTGFNTLMESPCSNCLIELSTEYYMANFFTLLIAGCRQEPSPGKTLSISGNPFSTNSVVITTPLASGLSSSSSGGISLGGKVGIAVGGIVFLLFVTGFTIVCCGKRRRRRVLAEENRFRQTSFSGPLGGLTSWQQQNHPERRLTEESPATDSQTQWQHGWENGSEHTFSPYMSQYNSPVSANDALGEKHRGWHGPAISAVVEQKEREIEMQRLGHEMGQDAESRGFTVQQPPIIRNPVPIAREKSKEKEAFPTGF